MDSFMKERLQRMSYSELRKIARKSGINGKQKAKELISLILKNARSADDSFNSLEQQVMNSSNKNKIEKFEEDMKTPSDTPRRDTYTVETPNNDNLVSETDLIQASASPILKNQEEHDKSLATMPCDSLKKLKKRKVSFVTPIRRSARLSTLTPHYSSVKDRLKTPIPSKSLSGSRKNTPACKAKMFTGSLFIMDSARRSSEGGKRPSTPMPNPKPKRMTLSFQAHLETPSSTPISSPVPSDAPISKQNELAECTPSNVLPPSASPSTPATLLVPDENKSPLKGLPAKNLPLQLSSVKGKKITPKSQKKMTPLQSSSLKATRTTPNFKKLHQKQFDKMESIEEYIKRKQVNSAKVVKNQSKVQASIKNSVSKKQQAPKVSKIPKKFGGIPFVPSITSTTNIKTDFGFSTHKWNLTPGQRIPAVKFGSHNQSGVSKKLGGLTPKPPLTPAKLLKADVKKGQFKARAAKLKENTPLQKKFDLKASLSRKLTYKPHTGPLKPMAQANANTSIFISQDKLPKVAPTENRVIKAKRAEVKGVLKGVRKNKRFELQMKNRKM